MGNILEIKDLQVRYGGIQAVQGVSLDIPRGSIVTLIGANGAGKSSIIRSIAGLNKHIGTRANRPCPCGGSSPKTWSARAFPFRPKGAASFRI